MIRCDRSRRTELSEGRCREDFLIAGSHLSAVPEVGDSAQFSDGVTPLIHGAAAGYGLTNFFDFDVPRGVFFCGGGEDCTTWDFGDRAAERGVRTKYCHSHRFFVSNRVLSLLDLGDMSSIPAQRERILWSNTTRVVRTPYICVVRTHRCTLSAQQPERSIIHI